MAVISRWADGYGGATTYSLEHARRFVAEGWEVHLYGERLDRARLVDAGAVGHRLTGWPWGRFFKRRFFAWRIDRALKAERFDLVVGHGESLFQDVLFLHNCVHAAHEAIHGSPLPEHDGVGRFHRRLLEGRGFRLLIANSELMKRDIVRRFSVPAGTVEVVYPGYDPRRFRSKDREALGPVIRRQLGIGSEDVLAGLVTSGDFKKRGVEIFIAALGGLPPDMRLRTHGLIVGKERGLERYRRMATEAGLGRQIHFLPAIPEVQRYYHALDIFVYPALYEEFGLVVQEAFACGVPVLTSCRVGAGELLGKDVHQMLLEKPESGAFSQRLATLIAEPHTRRRWAELGIEACRWNTWDANFRRIRERYDSLLLKAPVADAGP